MNYLLFPFATLLFIFSACSLKPVRKTKNITYSKAHSLKLDVYSPRKIKEPKKILVFVYGGNWIHGKKSLYRFFGKGMARKGIICVVMDYRLSPLTDIDGMASDVAEVIKWVNENCTSFKGDSTNIYVSGHSAGGHLAAMVATDNAYFDKLHMKNPVKGVVLIDAFGLDMYTYLRKSQSIEDTLYKRPFSYDAATWKRLSPVYYLNKETPPFMQFVGGKTYPAIIELNYIFYNKLKEYQPNALYIVLKGKHHVPMIAQFYNTYAKPYKTILNFMDVH